MKHLLLAATLLLTALALPLTAEADAPKNITAEERALLSPWCRHTNGLPGYQEMLSKYGQGWSHMHHYCYAELDWLRLYKAPRTKSRVHASHTRALSNLDYVLSRTNPDFAFWHEVMILKIRLVDRYVSPESALPLARALVNGRPELADSYTILADLLLKTGKRQEAQQVLAEGAEKASDQDRFARLKSILPR